MSQSPGFPASDLPSAIGRYQIRARVAIDVVDEVYIGFDPMIQRPVAIKLFQLRTADPSAEARVKETFYQEMQRTGILVHPNIVTLYDAGEMPGALFVASEFVEGVSLADRLTTAATLDLPMRVSMLVQMIDALEYAREAGVPHLNLKPTSVHIGEDFTLKVGGFGVAAVIDVLTAVSSLPPRPTSRYASPERAQGLPGDARSDVYSFAHLALDVLVGIDEASAAEPGWGADRPPALPRYLDDLGVSADRWASVFGRALATDPARRYDSVLTLKFELVLLLGIDETDAHMSWDNARAIGQLAPLGGAPGSAGADDLDGATMMADPRMRISTIEVATIESSPDEAPTGSETILAPSGDHFQRPALSPQPVAEDPDAETATMLTPSPWPGPVRDGDSATRPAVTPHRPKPKDTPRK